MVDLVETITCRDCGEEKPRWRPQQNLCHDCYKEYLRKYQAQNREKMRADKRAHYHKKKVENPEWREAERKRTLEYYHGLRREVLNAYGGMKCACCGETEEQFLTLDHINNDGADHRRELLGKSGKVPGVTGSLYGSLKKKGFPPGFQVLCMNCNFSKFRNGGVCIHQAKSTLKTA